VIGLSYSYYYGDRKVSKGDRISLKNHNGTLCIQSADYPQNATIVAISQPVETFSGGETFLYIAFVDPGQELTGRNMIEDFICSSYGVGANPLPRMRQLFGGKWEFSSDITRRGCGSEWDAGRNGIDAPNGHVHFFPDK
jgi:hypothetical protein